MEKPNPSEACLYVQENGISKPRQMNDFAREGFGKFIYPSMLIVSTLLFAITGWYIHSSFAGVTNPSLPRLYNMVALRTLQEATSLSTSLVFLRSLRNVQWNLAARTKGAQLATFLGLAPSTSAAGQIKCMSTSISTTFGKSVILIRLLTVLAIMPAAGLVLFNKITTATIYEPISLSNVTAGVGQFDGSLVQPFVINVNHSISYTLLTMASSLLFNPQFSIHMQPVNCTADTVDDCDSYLLPGGVQTVYPSFYPSDPNPFVVIDRSPAVQLDFESEPDMFDTFSTDDCATYGGEELEVELCIKPSTRITGAIVAEALICPGGMQNGKCGDSDVRQNISVTLSSYQRWATTVNAISNNSIIQVLDISVPQIFNLTDTQNLSLAMGWLFNYPKAGLPYKSSPAYQLWNQSPGMSDHDWEVQASPVLRNSLACVLWFFNLNSYGNLAYANAIQVDQNPATAGQTLPSKYHTIAKSSQSSTRFIVNKLMFKVYLVLQSIPIVFAWIVFVWTQTKGVPDTKLSSFPLLEFKFKAKMDGNIPPGEELADVTGVALLEGFDGVVIRHIDGKNPDPL